MGKITKSLDKYFEITKYNSNWRTEILAGVSVYLSLAYIFVVNPAILSTTGMNVSAVLFATILAAGLSTLAMGLWARLPFALAPGLEMNGFFAFVVCGTLGLTWNQALGAVFWSGIICVILTFSRFRKGIIDSIPIGLKRGMAVSVGIFVLTIGLFLSGIVIFDKGQITGFGSPISAKGCALLIGLAISIILGFRKLKFPGGMLVAIIFAAIYCKTQGIVSSTPAKLSSDMFLALAQLEWFPSSISIVPVFLVFFLIDFYGSIGKFIGLTASTDLVQKDGRLVRIDKALYVDGAGTIGGSILGTSSIITYVESSIGISLGGRTGLVAVVCGVLMLASLIFTPLVGLVPVEATSGILIFVGYLLIRDTCKAKDLIKTDYIIAAIMSIITFATFSLDKTMFFGFLAYTIIQVFIDKKRNWYLISSTLLIGTSIILQYALN